MSGEYQPTPKGFATRTIHAGQDPEQWSSSAVVPPIVLSTTYKQHGPAEFKQYDYSRCGNPSRNTLETCLAAMEGAKHGLCFSSGLGSIMALLGLFESGDHIISGDDIYGGSNCLFTEVGTRFGLEVSFVDMADMKNISAAIKPNTKLIWLETPTNPTLKVIDIRSVSKIAKAKNILLAVDNTFLTCYLQRPLELGADMSMYSLTKYMNGHSDVIMGAIITNCDKLNNKMRFLQHSTGIVPSPFDCAMVNRGLKTLPLRMKQHSASALKLAQFLETHPKVEKVVHPGLKTHPQHDLFKSQTSGHSGMLSIYLKGSLAESRKFLQSFKVFTLADSLGGFESLASLPTLMSHPSVPEDQKKMLNITDSLVRLSVGLEDYEDLEEDINNALNSV